MPEVKVLNYNDDPKQDLERAITLFKKYMFKDGILRELKRKTFAMSRSERRKIKDKMALNRRRKKEIRIRGREEWYAINNRRGYAPKNPTLLKREETKIKEETQIPQG